MRRRLRFIDLFAGVGGFHRALVELGHECVYASEIHPELRALYGENFPDCDGRVYGDITTEQARQAIPEHDILCAGFPCQPFSKSGFQYGFDDPTRGTLFHEIIVILRQWQPEYLILENVGNFELHDRGNTWQVVQHELDAVGYDIRGTTHKASGGPGLISPHHLGEPHTRGRFFIVGRHRSRGRLAENPLPDTSNPPRTTLDSIVLPGDVLDERDRRETELTACQVRCIEHWNEFLRRTTDERLPSFPIWGDELWQRYPFEHKTPYTCSIEELRACLGVGDEDSQRWGELLALLPSYAREETFCFPKWKIAFIRQSRNWLASVRDNLGEAWIEQLRQFPASHRKLEWNCQGEERDLWAHVLQFRPSGLRVKRYTACPALVAMTDTQIPILGPKRRFLTRIEGLRLQGLPDDHRLPKSRIAAFAALGNAVHVKVVKAIVQRLLADALEVDLDRRVRADRWTQLTFLRGDRSSNGVADDGQVVGNAETTSQSLQRTC